MTSTLNVAANGLIADLNLVFDDLAHTCLADLHIELTSPAGTNVVLVRSFTENGILTGLGCPHDFMSTIFDDDASANLKAGVAPFTGNYNVEHTSVVSKPLSVFDGESAAGTWTLSVSDRGAGDTGSLNGWHLEVSTGSQEGFTSTDVPKSIPDDTAAGSNFHALTSPAGTNVVLVRSFTENGILTGLGCPHDFMSTIFDDDASANLKAGVAPFTGNYNVEHTSVVSKPLSVFDGESAAGTWTLSVSDRGAGDTGTLNSWGLNLTVASGNPPCDGDFNHNGQVTVDELVTAINNALTGCPQ